MKNFVRNSSMLLAATLMFASCKKFEDTNVNPLVANGEQVQIEYFLNNSITEAQMNPDVAERAFVLYWKTAGHQHSNGGISSGTYNDEWSNAYYNQVAGWLNSVNTGIQIANEQTTAGNTKAYTNNLIQVSRIWRAYLMSEMSDNFGPIPVVAFQVQNPSFNEVKDVYYYLLEELKDASAKLDVNLATTESLKKLDPAYQNDYTKWRKYANSLRMRLAMRLSEVDASKAQTEFQDAAAGGQYITTMAETFQVRELGGWNALTGVMSREWNAQFISATLYNLYLGLGGIETKDQLATSYHSYIKPANYMGLKLDEHFTSRTNNPSAGYWFDGLPNTIDPRAYKTFIIPGDFTNPNFNSYSTDNARNTVRNLVNDAGATVKVIDAKFTYNASNTGDWGVKGTRNQVRAFEGTMPRLANQFRTSASSRIFFAPWETYFLLAEASLRGWTVPMSAKAAYNAGVTSSLAYWGEEGRAGQYLASTAYNRVGTSVSWDHTTEPPASRTMNYVDGYTNAAGTTTVLYPKNDLYKSGTVKNDLLTKIITQKFIAQTPWLPLEAWNDQRRLGLPFFENPAIENPLPNLPALTTATYMTSSLKFFPQRLRYPASLKNSNGAGYSQAVAALGGPDEVLTPLWWAKKQ